MDRVIVQGSTSMPGSLCQYSRVANKSMAMSHHHLLCNFLDVFHQLVRSEEIDATVKTMDYSVFGHDVRQAIGL